MTEEVIEIEVEEQPKHLKRTLWFLLVMFVLGTLCLMAFNLVFQTIGDDLGAPESASLITAIPGIVLGIVCFIYGSLGDFVSLKKMATIGIVLLMVGSVCGFLLGPLSVWWVIVCRCIQTAGAQVAGSVYLVLTAKYVKGVEKVTYFGIFTAGYQLSTAIGVLAGGFLSQLNWAFLFLIPVVTIVLVPSILSGLPDVKTANVHIDVPGFVIFGLATGLLTIFFTNYAVWCLIAAIVIYILFAVYINKAEHPFITPKFFKNVRWLMSISIFLIIYFFNYAIAPTYNALGAAVYGLTSAQVSLFLLWGYLVAVVVAVTSGKIDAAIGRRASIILSCILIACGFLIAAIWCEAGVVVLAISACVVYAGVGLIYSPVVDTVVGTVAPEESGRAIGMNDLVLNVSGSIGIAIFAPMMVGNAADSANFVGVSGMGAAFSNLFLIYAGIAVLCLVVYLLIMNHLVAKKA
jgi:DHA2 family metal-tetracycline-proton antiporter-like MFS transporter